MKSKFIGMIAIVGILVSIYGTAYANWGWENTDDPTPYYHQEWGKWYQWEDAKVFMVQIDDKTYKYLFDCNGKFINGWVTYMPMRLN